jgi:hypothetical protein
LTREPCVDKIIQPFFQEKKIMSTRQRLLLLCIIQIFPLLIYDPASLRQAAPIIGIVALMFLVLAYGLWRGRLWALTLSILLQGFNIIVRLMMFFPNSWNPAGEFDAPYFIANLIAIGLSTWLLLRFDRQDVRALMTA